MKKVGRIFLNVIVISATTILLLEIMLQLFSPLDFRTRGDKVILPANTFRVFELESPGLEPRVRVTKNNLGLRGPSLNEVPADVIRIITVGGSTTENLYLSDDNTWTARLGKKLGRSVSPLWINNAGLDGHSTYGHLQMTRHYLIDLKPDVIIYFIGVNDVGLGRPSRFDQDATASGIDFSSTKQVLISSAKYLDITALALSAFRAARAYNWGLSRNPSMWSQVSDSGGHPDYFDAEDDESAARKQALLGDHLSDYRLRLLELVDVGEANGIVTVFITQPAAFGTAIEPATGWDLGRIRGLWDLDGHNSWQVLELYNDVTRTVARERGLSLIDLAQAMPKSIEYFYDTIHFTNHGAEFVADYVQDQLCPAVAAQFPAHQVRPC